MGHGISHNYPPKPKWTADQIPDLTGQVIIVTGSNTGIGKVTAEELLKHNAQVYMAVRSKDKAEAAIKELKEKTGKQAVFLKLDLSDLHSVKVAAEEFSRLETKLHVLINNAGVAAPPLDQFTSQGYDMQWGTNVIGHFYFTKLLLPLLISTAKTTPDNKVRIVNTASYVHFFYPKLDFNTFRDNPARQKLGRFGLYGQSKFGNILVSNELATRYGDQGIVSTSLHPGSIRTELQRHGPAFLVNIINQLFFYPPSLGALTQLWAATSPECADYNGKYLTAWARLGEPDKATNDPTLAKELWEYLEEQVKDI